MAFFIVFADVIYSVSTDDVITVSCFFEDQVTKKSSPYSILRPS